MYISDPHSLAVCLFLSQTFSHVPPMLFSWWWEEPSFDPRLPSGSTCSEPAWATALNVRPHLEGASIHIIELEKLETLIHLGRLHSVHPSHKTITRTSKPIKDYLYVLFCFFLRLGLTCSWFLHVRPRWSWGCSEEVNALLGDAQDSTHKHKLLHVHPSSHFRPWSIRWKLRSLRDQCGLA